ncbi:site-specific integrase [Actomonas aquatica]|uniref:Site-specific integrase n=1 Tax=Actomonas aquatica TaxID=2866162 RepID=A0ABZ1CA86_9BACT|nr:site-specific integrase [Opitutus sp. WL0086]WRQ88604.1 site-specific integrase [Opitutus sp. WL0086]
MNLKPNPSSRDAIEHYLDRLGFPPKNDPANDVQLRLLYGSASGEHSQLRMADILPEHEYSPGIPTVLDLHRGWRETTTGKAPYQRDVLTDCVWLLYVALHYHATNTHIVDKRRNLIRSIAPAILSLPVTAIPSTAVRLFFDHAEWAAEDLGIEVTTTVNQVAANFSLVIREGQKSLGIAYPNLHDAVIGERFKIDHKPVSAPSAESLQQLFATLPGIPRDIQQSILLALFTGLRHRETRFIRWSDIGLSQNPPMLRVLQRGTSMTKNGHNRTTAGAPGFLELLHQKFYRGQPLDEPIVYPLSDAKDALRMKQTVDYLRAVELYNTPNLMHYCRKIAITALIKEFGLRKVSRYAGHATTDLTEKHYVLRDWTDHLGDIYHDGMRQFLSC